MTIPSTTEEVYTLTDVLFARPSVVYGFARTLDLAAQLDSYNESLTPAIADFVALFNDWSMVGNDLALVIRRELEKHLQDQVASKP